VYGGTYRTLRKPMRSHALCAAMQEITTERAYSASRGSATSPLPPEICPYAIFSLCNERIVLSEVSNKTKH